MTNRIIKVTGCHSCDYRFLNPISGWICNNPKMKPTVVIMLHIKNKTLPDNCPLDKQQNDATSNNEGETLMELLEHLSTCSHGNELSIGNENVDKAIQDIVLYVENHASEYADYVLMKKTPQIRQDALKHIRAVYDKYIKPNEESDGYMKRIANSGLEHYIISQFIEAIKADIKESEGGK